MKLARLSPATSYVERILTHQLELNWHQAEVDDLDRGPNHKVGLERRHIHVPQLVLHGAPTTTLGNRHDSEESGNTKRRKHQLVHRHPLHRRAKSSRFCDREGLLQELEPLELHRGHAEAVGHEARQSLKVKRRWEDAGVRDKVAIAERVFAVEFLDLDSDGVILGVRVEGALSRGSLLDGGYGLCDGICYASQDRIGDHHREDFDKGFLVSNVEGCRYGVLK